MIKSTEAIAKMRVAGKLAAQTLEYITPFVQPGVSTLKLNDLCHQYIVDELQAIPAPLNYHGFPKSICTSVNQVVCHGIPNEKMLKDGDIINIDVTVIKDQYHGDTSIMLPVGKVSIIAKRLIDVTRECLYAGIQQVKPGAYLGDIGAAIEQLAHQQHFSVVEDYCGHGIGKTFHEEPQVLHYGKKGAGMKLQAGMTFTIEPMINQGTKRCKKLADGWTVITKDRKLSAQWEHTLLVTETGVEILTLRTNETPPAFTSSQGR
jgi:methionyl aminopeptidase